MEEDHARSLLTKRLQELQRNQKSLEQTILQNQYVTQECENLKQENQVMIDSITATLERLSGRG